MLLLCVQLCSSLDTKHFKVQTLSLAYLYIYFFIVVMYCHHPSSITAHMLRQHPTALLLVPGPWAASLKHALVCTEANPARACVTLCKLFQEHIFLTTPHCCVLHVEDICIQISL